MFRAAFTSALQAYPQAVHANRAWLSRESASTCPHAQHRWLVNCGLTFSTLPGAFSASRRTSRPHPAAGSPGSARPWPARSGPDPRPGRAGHVRDLQVLDPDQVKPAGNAGAGLLRPVLAPVGLAGAQPGDGVLDLAAAVRPAPGPGQRALQAPDPPPFGPVRAGACRSSPVDRAADTVTPRSMPTAWPLPGAGIGSGITAKAMCQRPARSIVTCRTSRPAAPAGTSGTAPTPPSAPRPGRPCRTRAHVPLPSVPPGDPEALVASGFAPGRPPGRVVRGRGYSRYRDMRTHYRPPLTFPGR